MRFEFLLWLLIALCAGALLGGAIMWAAMEPLPPDCAYQRTAGNWQPGCVERPYIRSTPTERIR